MPDVYKRQVVASAVKNGEGNFGYNAGTEQYGDMIEMCIRYSRRTIG